MEQRRKKSFNSRTRGVKKSLCAREVSALLFESAVQAVQGSRSVEVCDYHEIHGRIGRWMSLFAEYDFEVRHRHRPRNENDDYLSRSSTATDLVLSTGLEDNLKTVVE